MTQTRKHGRSGALVLGGAAALALLVGLPALGLVERSSRARDLQRWTEDAAVPTLAIETAAPPDQSDALTLPGRIAGLDNASLYARTNGYVASWNANIGSKVRAGDLLARINAPELDRQLRGAEADLQSANADYQLSIKTDVRERALVHDGWVSRQQADNSDSSLAAKMTRLHSASERVRELRADTGFENIVAPFDGIVTRRTVQFGELVAANTTTASPLFTVTRLDRIRIYVDVPQAELEAVGVGSMIPFTVPEYPATVFWARLVTTAEAVNASTGSQTVELQMDNLPQQLSPGDYAEIRFLRPVAPGSVSVPASALIFRSAGPAVTIPDARNRASIRPVTVADDLGAVLVLNARVAVGERVIVTPPDSLKNGDQVRVVGIAPAGHPGGLDGRRRNSVRRWSASSRTLIGTSWPLGRTRRSGWATGG